MGRPETRLWSVEEPMEDAEVQETLVDNYSEKLGHEGVEQMGLQRDGWPTERWGFVSFCLWRTILELIDNNLEKRGE